MKTTDELIETYPEAYMEGMMFFVRMANAIAALAAGEPETAERTTACNGFTVGCPS